MQHTLVAIVEDRPGVLNRVASLFRRRAYNIESLTVGHTERRGVSRMTIVLDSDQTSADRIVANLYKLLNVLYLADLSRTCCVVRDLALVKVRSDAAQRSRVLQLAERSGARVVDSGDATLTIEVTGEADRVESVVGQLHTFGIVEMVRTGLVAMACGDGALREPGVTESGMPQQP